jgi:hypothetical protein
MFIPRQPLHKLLVHKLQLVPLVTLIFILAVIRLPDTAGIGE